MMGDAGYRIQDTGYRMKSVCKVPEIQIGGIIDPIIRGINFKSFYMRFFSRIVLICNVCFLLSILLRFVEKTKNTKGNIDGFIPYHPLESTIATLGLVVAFMLNTVFALLCLYWLPMKKIKHIPRWIVLFNLLIFPLQVYYHFFLP